MMRSANNFICSILYLSRRYCYLLLSWKIWNWFECAVGGIPPESISVNSSNRLVCIMEMQCVSFVVGSGF